MSVEAMTMVTLSGPEQLVDTALQKLVLNREFHPEDTISNMAEIKRLLPLNMENPYSEPLGMAFELLEEMNVEPIFSDFSGKEFSVKSATEYISVTLKKIKSYKEQREENLLSIQNDAVYIQQLSHFENFDVELSDLFDMRYLKFRFGRISVEAYKECAQVMGERPDVYYIPGSRTERWVYGAYFVLPTDYAQVDALFGSMGFERIHIDAGVYNNDTAHNAVERMKAESQHDDENIAVLDKEIEDLGRAERERALYTYSWLRFMSEAFELRSYAGCRHGKFYLVGWVPKLKGETFANESKELGLACILSAPRDSEKAAPPVKLKNGFFSNIYQPFVEMYGIPAYGELDPRLFMCITYTLLFGIMFGDVGQGALLVVIGLFLARKGNWLGKIVSLCGVSAIVFGFIYGSVFGYEELIPGFNVLKDGNTMRILIIAVALGVALILICMILNIITGIRQKDIKKIFFDSNGIAGFVMYGGIAFGIVSQMLLNKPIMTPLYIGLVIILPLFLIFAATPLTKLITGQKDWKPESVGMFIVEGFFELFETMLSYVSNTVSFLRVGAFAISHAGMMMVVYLLSSGENGYSLGGLIFGNLLVAGLETVLVCIQVMRLEFYEMFGRFYQSGGEKFSPVFIDYSAAD